MYENLKLEVLEEKRYVTLLSQDLVIRTPQEFLDILAWGGERETNLFLFRDTNFAPEFYDLKTGLAGEILQKASTYSCRLAVVGTFAMVENERFRELMSELNKGWQVRFAQTVEEGVGWLLSP